MTATSCDNNQLKFLYVERPCGDMRLWESLMTVLAMGSVVIFWPGGPPLVADASVVSDLPKDMTDPIAMPVVVRTARELLHAVQNS